MTISSKSEKILIPTANKKGYEEAHEGDGVIWKWKGARGTVQRGGVSNPDDRSAVHGSRREEERCRIIGYWPGTRWKQARAIFDLRGIVPTLTAQMGGKHANNFVWIIPDAK